ncbi:allophanate hydrolase subunit 1 [Herbiconiux sp. CPCC 203407]|uniref:Allophanate hydrolase subunit 1 n=1 Tax=Herbiconiux oxytropis TaxID=2970915 RepID=A0AA41XD21_9MICO|nr:allophanate hydrolase subunit 1 [Herbiconiux oxytropis]MCS5720379.1 allophanate hydrolase subunit 1 [Herbiconiux oxytropis]MCS5725952.1 allophanate hydrolase subunit 1 [Herbiconiux oxytropis]
MGESAILVELPDATTTLTLYRRLLAEPPPSVVDLVPAERTVLVVSHPGSRAAAERWLLEATAADAPGADPNGIPAAGGSAVTIPVRYDGPDLADVATLLGITADEVVAAHTGAVWSAAFIGFAPGFAYLRAADGRLDVPRRATPRAAVPPGAVALAAGYCGIYPRESPGGWHLIGTTDAVLWDAERADPALVAPGTEVGFRRVD